jgi:hypothetical protein
MNQKNTEMMYELIESINRFNQFYSYICNIDLRISNLRILILFTIKNEQDN